MCGAHGDEEYISHCDLENIPLSMIKIDNHLIQKIAEKEANSDIIYSIQKMAESRRLQTIATSIEDAALLESLRTIGIDYAQGYHISKTYPIEFFINQPKASQLELQSS